MSTTLEAIQQRLTESELLSADALATVKSQWEESTDPRDLNAENFVDWLVDNEQLTEFQGDALLTGHTGPFMLGPYRVYEHIASGWLGGVFRAVHTEHNQPVSLKVYRSEITKDHEKVARMRRELRVTVSLDHPCLVRAFDVGQVGHISYLAMEDLQGETLESLLEIEGRLAPERACRIARNVAKGLASLHESDIIHRDIRPENIWILPDGSPRIMEFGGVHDAMGHIDSADGRELSTSETVIGQYTYMAPEQAQDVRDADERSDIYALGCVLYHCLTGQPPFTSSQTVKLVMMHTKEEPKPVSQMTDGIPKPFDETMAAMLAKDPADRFQSADEVAYALDQYAGDVASDTITVVDVSPAYIEWARARHPTEEYHIAEDAVGITPELTEFLTWIGKRKVRKRPT